MNSNASKAVNATLLVVDDDPVTLSAIANVLKDNGYRILVANNGEKALSIVSTKNPDLVLLDIHMPGLSGIETCKKIKGNPVTEHIPIVFLTASDSEIEDAFKAGGVDYIVKPFRENELLVRVDTHLKVSHLMVSLESANLALESLNASLEEKVRERTKELVAANASLRKEINQRRQLQDQLYYVSKYDFVTRMYNRTSMEEKLAEKLLYAHTHPDYKGFFLFMDLDQFRIVNDTFGHIAGDELLRQLSELMKGIFADGTVIARMGGDEFAFIYEAKDNGEAVKIAKKIKAEVEGFHFHWDDEVFQVGLSIGLLEIDDSFDDVNHLISIAERTCYESKSKGGREISIYNINKPRIDHSKKQMRWVPIIQRALEKNEFFLCGQHITDSKGEHQNKLEVLIRLETSGQKVLPPGHFIPIAERYHLISSVDRWVLAHALSYNKLFENGYQLSINLSGESISKESFVDFTEQTIRDSGVDPSQLCLEITETSALSNIEATKNFISRLSKLGCQFALDDFGTGTSSYGYLKELPVDFLKIDGIFVRDLDTEKINRLMVDSITKISSEMGIKVVAECVENEASLKILNEMGVHYAQGFYMHKPQKLSEILGKPEHG